MGRPAVVCRWARPFPGPEPEASSPPHPGGARLGALLPQGLLLGLPHVKPGAPEEGARLLQAPLKPALPGLGCGWDRGSSWPQTSPCTPAPLPLHPQSGRKQRIWANCRG